MKPTLIFLAHLAAIAAALFVLAGVTGRMDFEEEVRQARIKCASFKGHVLVEDKGDYHCLPKTTLAQKPRFYEKDEPK